MNKKALIVGAGITGATIARILYENDFDVTVIEQTNEIGGACSDTIKNNAYKQNHGSHIFHTNDTKVMDFISNFAELRPYMHKVKALVNGKLVPVPFNVNSLDSLVLDNYNKLWLSDLYFQKEYTFEELRDTSSIASSMADWIYKKVFEFYSFKQWGKTPDKSTLNRVKAFRYSKDDRYFLDRFQGIPFNGFTDMIRKMLDADNIKVELNKEVDTLSFKKYDVVFYTGTIDKLLDFKLGKLPYRTCKFKYDLLPVYKSQEAAVINYTQDYNFTRSHDYSWYFPSQNSYVAYEYPKQHESEDEPRYYPIKEEENLKLYNDYKDLLAKEYPNVIPAGRLGTYQYLDMDKAIEQAIDLTTTYLESINC